MPEANLLSFDNVANLSQTHGMTTIILANGA
jgi:hypothetical protein